MPFVYADFDQAQLDAAYNNSAHVGQARRDAYVGAWVARSAELRATRPHRHSLAYGPSPREVLDFVPCGKPGAPTFAFIHGGYWQMNDKESSFHLAAGVVPHGINFVNLDYTLAHRHGLAYGPSPREVLDFVPCGKPGAPTFAFIHGGYWQLNDKESSFHLAAGVVPHGINFVNLDYTPVSYTHLTLPTKA